MSSPGKYIADNWLPILSAYIPASIVIGFLPSPGPLYYGLLFFLFFLAFINVKTFVLRLWALVVVMALSCFISDAPPFFKIWERYIFFVLLLGSVTPMMSSPKMYSIRSRTLKYLLWVCCFIGVASFFCYFLGINYMPNPWIDAQSEQAIRQNSGWFGGITVQSMIMGPSSGIGLTYFVWLMMNRKFTRNWRIALWAGIVMCFIVVLLSASRAAFMASVGGVAIVLLMKFRGQIVKFAGVAALIIAFMAVAYPLYSTYTKAIVTKQQANLKSGGTFASREDRWQHRLEEFSDSPILGIGPGTVKIQYIGEYDKLSGGIESGSSWLSVLSMTGLAGTLIFLSIILPTTFRLYKKACNGDKTSAILISLLVVFYLHMIAEGYIFAAGNYLCFLFWLLLGVSIAHAQPSARQPSIDFASL